MRMSKLHLAAVILFAVVSAPAQQFQDQTAARLPIQAVWSEEVDAADIDGDGDLDLVYGKGNGFSSAGAPQQNTILINNGAGVFADQTASRLPVQLSNTKDLDLIDVDGDGDFDLVVANAFLQQPRLYLNGGAGTFTDVTGTHLPAVTLNSFGVVAGDIDKDGDLDLLFTDSGPTTFGGAGGQPRAFINDGMGHFADQTATRLPVTNIPSSVDADLSDVDNDFDLDLIVVSRDGTPSRLFLNNGSGVFTNGTLPGDGTGTYEYATGDVDGDNDADIFVIGVSGLTEGVFTNNPLGAYSLAAGAVVGNPSSDDNDAAFGDIDDDGDFDVAVAALSTAERLLVNNGAGVFTYNAALITAFVDSSMDGEFADVDDDGDLDYLSAVGESGAFQNRIYINTGAAGIDTHPPTFRLQALGSSTPSGAIPVLVAVKDVMATDGDPEYTSVTLNYSVGGTPGSVPMKWAGADFFRGVIPFAPFGSNVTYSVTAVDRHGTSGTSATLAFSPMVHGPALLAITTTGAGDLTIAISDEAHPGAEEFLFVSTTLPPVLGSGPFLGLGVDAFNIVFTPVGVPPLHDYLNGAGLQITAFGPGSLPPGFMFDARAVIVVSPSPVLTNILRMTL